MRLYFNLILYLLNIALLANLFSYISAKHNHSEYTNDLEFKAAKTRLTSKRIVIKNKESILTTTNSNEPVSNKTKIRKNNGSKNHHRISNRNTKRVAKLVTSTTTLSRPLFSIEDSDYDSQPPQFVIPPEKIFNITAKVGETVVLNCAINSSYGINPGVIWMQGKLGNVLTLNTNRITLDQRFDIIQHAIIQKETEQTSLLNGNLASILGSRESVDQDGALIQSHEISNSHHHANQFIVAKQQSNEFSYYNLRIENVQLSDENEYACETTLTKRSDDQPNIHSLISLYITRNVFFLFLKYYSKVFNYK
jgi:hypothetical protein